MGLRRVGVEEELLLVEPGMGRPRAVAGTVLHAARQVATGPGRGPDAGRLAGDGAQALDFELQLQQLETNTQPRRALEELGREVRRCRALAAEAAGRAGAQVAALATSPVPVEPEMVAKSRARTRSPAAGCPACGRQSRRVHSRYERRLSDTAVAGREIVIQLRVRDRRLHGGRRRCGGHLRHADGAAIGLWVACPA